MRPCMRLLPPQRADGCAPRGARTTDGRKALTPTPTLAVFQSDNDNDNDDGSMAAAMTMAMVARTADKPFRLCAFFRFRIRIRIDLPATNAVVGDLVGAAVASKLAGI